MGLNDYERKHNKILRKYGAECTVLLKKDGHFPIERGGDIALYGSGARNTVKGGTGSGEVNSRFFVTVEKGLTRAGFNITTTKWLDCYDRIRESAKESFFHGIKKEAKEKHTQAILIGMGRVMPEPEYSLPIDGAGDTAIYVLSRISGEGSDREPVGGDIKLTETEVNDITLCNEKYNNFMLVLNVGGVVDLSDVGFVKNILILSQLGVKTGDVLADIILGRSNPSGKLATTWSAWEDYCNIGDFGEKNDTRYKEGIYVGYRYFDSVGKKALYPFGFGLSYTEFAIEKTYVSIDRDEVTVRADVTNIGKYSGKEVVQVYVSIPEGKLDEPYQVLAGFSKTGELAPGTSEEVEVRFSMRDMASFSVDDHAYILEPGDYIFRVGNSSRNTVIAGVGRLDSEAVTERVKSVIPAPDFEDWKPLMVERDSVVRNDKNDNNSGGNLTNILELNSDDIAESIAEYDRDYEIDESLKNMPLDKLIKTSIGAFDSKRMGLVSIIGNAGSSVAGAAGQTCMEVEEYGITSLIMADGPAGLRLTRHYVRDDKGIHGLGEAAIPETMQEFLPKAVRKFMKLTSYRPKKGVEIKHQYATAIPIGTAIAQSFNLELAEMCGDIVGYEMELFNVNLWLAPALNIHRSIRCGRNFEYFSEDPLVSGLMAAALTSGVQKHRGCGTTIKHFTANNQEYNRTQSNSMMSERALREIYLKGFEICVKKSQPKAIMTSYNLLNGTHTSESRALIEDVLRCEFGYAGLVMTDWVVNGFASVKDCKYPTAHAPNVIMAGGDLFMPGTKRDYDEVVKAYETGMVTREQLLINATRILKTTKELL